MLRSKGRRRYDNTYRTDTEKNTALINSNLSFISLVWNITRWITRKRMNEIKHIQPLKKKKSEMTYTMWFPADEVLGAKKGLLNELWKEYDESDDWLAEIDMDSIEEKKRFLK